MNWHPSQSKANLGLVQNFSFPSCKSLKADEVKGAVRFAGEFFLRFFEGGPASTKDQGQQRGPQQRQGAGTVGVAQAALVLAADHVAPPMDFVLDSPVTADLPGQWRGRRFVGPQTGDEVTRAGGGGAGAFVGGIALQADQWGGVRVSRRLGFEAHDARRAFVEETARAFALGKRGEVPSSF